MLGARMRDPIRVLKTRWARTLSDWVRFGRSLGPLVAELRERDTWDPERLRTWQTDRVRALLRHAYDNVPFYRRRFESVGFHPDDFSDLADLSRIPPLTKKDIRECAEEIFARGVERWRLKKGRTGGSTGEPTAFYRPSSEVAWHVASIRRCEEMLGIRPGDVMVRVGGVAYAATWQKRLYGLWESRVLGVHGLTCDYLDDDRLIKYIDTIADIEARVVGGYPSAMYLLATKMLEIGRRLPSVQIVWTSSEMLQPFQRERIREAFGVEAFDTYGAGDVPVASECAAHNGLHLFQSARLIEVVKEDGTSARPGEVGQVLVTSFYNWDWPYIRYDLGDLVEVSPPGPCVCGIRLPKVSRVLGRTGDYLVSPDGRRATVANLTLIFGPVARQVRAYQFFQEDPASVEIRLVPGYGYDSTTETFITDCVRSVLGEACRITVRTMQDIPTTPAGKRLLVVSKVPQQDRPEASGPSRGVSCP